MKKEKLVNLGYKYRLYPTKDQQQILNHQMYPSFRTKKYIFTTEV